MMDSSHFSDCLNVVRLGADPFGKEDSTEVIQGAINQAKEGRGQKVRSVYFPDGEYRLDKGLVIDGGDQPQLWSIHMFSDGGAILKFKPGLTAITVKKGTEANFGPSRTHFRRLIVIRDETRPDDTGPQDQEREIGFHLNAPECRLDDVVVRGFRKAGVQLQGAQMTRLRGCRLWQNGVNVEDLGNSPACEIVGCRLIYGLGTGLIWNTRGLTVTGGAIEQNMMRDVVVGDGVDAIARFHGVHFERHSKSASLEPLIRCGNAGQKGNVQVAFERCSFFGSGSRRAAIYFSQASRAEVIGCWFQNFDRETLPIDVEIEGQEYYERGSVCLPKA